MSSLCVISTFGLHSTAPRNTGGSITLTSTNPFIPPAIDTNFLNTSLDINILRTAIRAARRERGHVRMGMCEDGSSVVDADLRVKGMEGLRVVDASVLVST